MSDAGFGVRGQRDRGSEAQMKERVPRKVFVGVGSGWGCLPMKGVWQASCLLALEIDWPWLGQSIQDQQRPPRSCVKCKSELSVQG